MLGDALWYARQLGATHLVDVATLTGACVVALGKTTSGLFGTPDAWVDAGARRPRERAGDRSWPMPIFDDYKEQLKSEIADFTNTGGRAGGAITGALFIKEFAGDLPWVHIDIAGTAWAEEAKPYQPKGATGVGVRTLVELGARRAPAWASARTALSACSLLQQNPIVVEVAKQPPPTRDVSIDAVLGISRWPACSCCAAVVGSALVGRRDACSTDSGAARARRRQLHTRLRI